MSIKGSCLCGSVRYEVEHLDAPIRVCHCRTCRKAHASAFNVSAKVAREHFHWIAGQDKLTCFESSPGKFRRFCSICGSQVVAEYPDKPYVTLRVATLDDDPGARPSQRMWMSHAVSWAEAEMDLPAYEQWHEEAATNAPKDAAPVKVGRAF
ncbi:GFA family protein [Rhodomicrobium vannielii ATCC 17100]|uniref:GFA family protein n=1 Tax=Rhodomicrobium vannielii TaxID=1069 RepID=UPI001917F3B5|nr:GFA family protein [Rhodomicrobium vannielii]MBJ7533714.1 GFA family protein [Rhodomicrobium vannielii ATCC 17100]